MDEQTTRQDLRRFIRTTLQDAILYTELASMAPNEQYSQLLLEISREKQDQGERLRSAYRRMYRENYTPDVERPVLTGRFDQILYGRILDEAAGFREYGIKLLGVGRNDELRNAYERAQINSNVHALRLLYMLHLPWEISGQPLPEIPVPEGFHRTEPSRYPLPGTTASPDSRPTVTPRREPGTQES